MTKLSAIILCFLIALSSCKDDGVTAKEKFIRKLSQTWVVDDHASIILDDIDITSTALDFELAISKSLKFTSNSQDLTIEVFPWPTAGSFKLNSDLTSLTRNDELVISASITNNDQLLMEFLFADGFDTNSGRIKGIRGNWKMLLSPK